MAVLKEPKGDAYTYPPKEGYLSDNSRPFPRLPIFITIANKGNVKECSNYHATALISHANKLMLKILQGGLQQYMNRELPGVQARVRKGRGTTDQIAKIRWIMEKARELRRMSISASLTRLKPLSVWILTNCGKF